MPMDTTIKNQVLAFISKEEMFTSVDVANAIKRSGVWIRTREVRDWLHANISDAAVFGDYAQTAISVCNGMAQAMLYHPLLKSPDDYVARDQISLTPDQVKDIQKGLVGTPNVSAAPDIAKIFDNTGSPDLSVVIKSKERIKIPGEITRKLGLKPGDRVDPSLIKTHKVLTGELYVNTDYRISISRSVVNWGTAPVKVILKNGVVEFDKA
jgi:hypothetical protein